MSALTEHSALAVADRLGLRPLHLGTIVWRCRDVLPWDPVRGGTQWDEAKARTVEFLVTYLRPLISTGGTGTAPMLDWVYRHGVPSRPMMVTESGEVVPFDSDAMPVGMFQVFGRPR